MIEVAIRIAFTQASNKNRSGSSFNLKCVLCIVTWPRNAKKRETKWRLSLLCMLKEFRSGMVSEKRLYGPRSDFDPDRDPPRKWDQI